jgi:hypothetical protein
MNGVRDDEAARLELLEARSASGSSRGIRSLDLAPVAEELERTLNPANCNDCEVAWPSSLARTTPGGRVQKVSNLILSMNLALREVESGRVRAMLAVDIRGNTDDAWLRGGRYILNNPFFAED